jgi:uncharacterized protein YbaR (Trm112 family)
MAEGADEREFPVRGAESGLVCPVCRGMLAKGAAEAIDCEGCGRVYPIRDGLPVLIAGEATVRS